MMSIARPSLIQPLQSIAPSRKATLSVALAVLVLQIDLALAATQQETDTKDILAATFFTLSWVVMIGLTGHLIHRFLNHNPADRFFKPQQSDSSPTQPTPPAHKC